MKLHLPKRLLTALLATFTVVTSLSSSAWAGWSPSDTSDLANTQGNIIYYLESQDSGASIDKADAVSSAPNDAQLPYTKVIIAAGRKGSGTQDATLGAVSIDASDTLAVYRNPWTGEIRDFDKLTIEELVIGDGTGAAAVDIGSNQIVQINAVSGTLSSVNNAGNLTLASVTMGGDITNAGTLSLRGELGGSGTITNSGIVVLQQGSTDVVLNNLVDKTSGKYNSSVIANTSTGNLVVENTGNKTLSGDITIANGGTVTLRGGTFGTSSAGLSNTIKTEAGTFLGFEDISVNIGGNANSNKMLDADIIVGNGATLTMTFNDRYHYDNKHTLKVLSGGSVVLGNTRQTLAEGFIVELAGGTITGAGDSEGMALDFYNDGTIKVTENSTLDANTGGHDNDATITLDVANGKTLTMNGRLVDTAVNKSNSGALVINSATSVSSINITGGNLTFGGDQITHTISGEIKSDQGSGSSVFKVETGSTLKAGSVNNAWGMAMVVDGKLNITGDSGLILKSGSNAKTISGAGSIETTKIDFGNFSKYTFTLDSLKVGDGGIVFEDQSELTLTIDGTAVEVQGAVNAQNGTMVLKNGSMSFGASKGNYIKNFTYVNGTLTHSALTVGNAEFSGQTLVNTGALTLNVVNVTDAKNLLKGDGEYSDAVNGNGFFNGQHCIIKGEEGSSLTYGDSFAVQYQGTAVEANTVDKGTSDLWVTINDTSTYYVNNGTVIFAGENATAGTEQAGAFVIKSGATLQLNGDVENGMSAKQVLTTTIGSGKIVLATTATLSNEQTLFKGDLSINAQGVLNFGYDKGATSDISSLSSLELDGGTFNYNNIGSTIHNFTVSSNGGTMYVADFPNVTTAWVNPAPIVFADTTTINGEFTYTTEYKSYLTIEQLSGSGKFIISTETTNNRTDSGANVRIESVSDFIGSIELKPDADGNNRVNVAINLNEEESLKVSQLTINDATKSSVTLTGSGVYDLGSATSLGTGVTLSDNWEGIVRMSNVTMGPLNVDAYGNAHSYLELIGVNGWLKKDSTEKLTGLILSKSEDGTLNGYTVTGSSDHTYKFNGKIKGDGDFTIATSSSDDATFAFNGDLSEYAGGIKVEAHAEGKTPTIGINLTGGGDIFAADANGGVHVDRGGVVNLNIGKAGETTNMRGAVINEGAGTLNVTVQGDTIFNADVDVSNLTITSGVGSVTLSGEQNTIKGALTITEGTGLTLDANSALTVNSPIQNNGNLDIQGAVNWDLSSTEGLTVTYSEEELSRKENRLDAGVISGLITGNSTLTISDNASATVNGKNGTFTDTGLVTVDDVVYYVMTKNTSDPTTPDSRVYDVGGGYKIKLSETVNVGNNTYAAGPKPTIDTNEAQGFYVGENGVLCISGATDTLKNISDVFASISGNGDIILRAPGIKTDSSEITEISVYNKIDFSGDLYIAPQGLYSGANDSELFEYGALKLHLFDNADISSFSSIQLGEYNIVDINGTINRANEEVGHFNNVNVLGNTEATINLNGGSNDEIVFGGDTTISPYKFGSSDATGGRLDLHYRQDGTIRIENLKDGEFPPSLKSSLLLVQTDSLGTDNDTHATLYIDSFEYTGSIYFYGIQKGTLKAEVTLSEDKQILKSSQYWRTPLGPSDESFIIKGIGTYIIDEGFGIEINYGELSRAMAEDNINRIWQGTVQITAFDGSANGTGNGMDFSYYGNEQSTIDMRGVKTDVVNWNTQGVPAQTSSSTTLIESDIIISNIGVEGEDSFRYGYEVTGGIAVQTYTGDISGTGDFVVSAGSNMTFNLQGNISMWAADDTETPEFIVQKGTQELNFSGNATEVNAIIKVAPSNETEGATLNVSVGVGDANTAHTTTFNESVVASSLTTYDQTTAQFKGETTRIGKVNLSAVKDAEAAVIEHGMVIKDNTVQGGEASNTVMSFVGEGSVSDAKLTNVVLTSTAGEYTGIIPELKDKVSINLKNLQEAKDVYLSGAVNFVSLDTRANFKFVETKEAFGQTYNEVRFESSSFSGMTLQEAIAELGYLGNITLTVANGIEAWKGTDAPTNVSILLKDFTVEGLTIGKRMEGMFDPLKFNVNDAQVVALSEDTAMSVSQLLNYASYREVYFVQQADGLFIRMSNIPEPTTATMSLLALAALASRRRRRK